MEIGRLKLGPEHAQMLQALNNPASYHWELCQDAEAIALREECIRVREKIMGHNNPRTLHSINILED